MIPWQDTAETRIQVRKHYGTIPVAPGLHIVGWEVRVWHQGPAGFGERGCNLCKKRVPEYKKKLSESLRYRPDFACLDACDDNCMWVPYAHECSSPVPWAARSVWPSEGWQQPHHHPRPAEDLDDVHDRWATPLLYSSAQLAYCAGLELLGIEPRQVHWKPPEPFPHPRCLNLRSA